MRRGRTNGGFGVCFVEVFSANRGSSISSLDRGLWKQQTKEEAPS